MKISVLSYNIHKGVRMFSRKPTLDEMRTKIREMDVDLVFLQEVRGQIKGVAGSTSEPQFEFLADRIWHHHAYGKNAVYTKGDHGNAILSKYPLVEWKNFDVSTNLFERRGVLYGKVFIPGAGILHLLCVHMSLFGRGRRAQLMQVRKIMDEKIPENDPLILAGDFNDWRGIASRHLKVLGLKEAFHETHSRHVATFPANCPVLPLDRIYYRGLRFESCGVIRESLSDHLPVWGEFSFST